MDTIIVDLDALLNWVDNPLVASGSLIENLTMMMSATEI